MSLTIILTLVLHLSTRPLKLLDHAFPVARTSYVASFRIAGAPLGPCFPLSTKYLYESLEKVYKYICPVEKWSWAEEVVYVCVCVCVLTKEKEETKMMKL